MIRRSTQQEASLLDDLLDCCKPCLLLFDKSPSERPPFGQITGRHRSPNPAPGNRNSLKPAAGLPGSPHPFFWYARLAHRSIRCAVAKRQLSMQTERANTKRRT